MPGKTWLICRAGAVSLLAGSFYDEAKVAGDTQFLVMRGTGTQSRKRDGDPVDPRIHATATQHGLPGQARQ